MSELTATAFKDHLVRAEDLPLVLPATGALGLSRGARVRIKLGDINEITLDITGAVIERLDLAAGNAVAEGSGSNLSSEEDEDESVAGPISIAVDVTDVPSDAPDGAPDEAKSASENPI